MTEKESVPTSSKPTSRDKLRTSILSGKNKRGESRVIDWGDAQVEVRQPTIKQIQELAKDAKNEDSNSLIKSVIEYCYVPGTNERVFEDTDEEELLQQPAGKWLDAFNKAVADMTGVDLEKAEKNLEKTA